jgi:nucleotide-binding universal stress UspA family protein
MAPSKISIPVDGSPASLRAVDFATKMATQDPGSSLVLLLVLLNVQNISAMALAGAAMAGDLQEAASQASDESVADLTEINECCRSSPHSTRSPRL